MYFACERYVKGMFFVKIWVCIGYVFSWKRYVLNTCHPVNAKNLTDLSKNSFARRA